METEAQSFSDGLVGGLSFCSTNWIQINQLKEAHVKSTHRTRALILLKGKPAYMNT